MSKVILLVDDDPVVIQISKHELEKQGYQILTAADGEEAFNTLKSQKVDCIVLDVEMPKMNGYTFLLEKIKIPEYADIPVLVLTAYVEMEPLFKRHGVGDYLLKPLKLQDFAEKVVQIAGSPD